MKLATAYNDQEVETLGVAKSKNFGFSKDAEEMLFTVFTKNIYSNPIGSVVREITSNCFDSHKEANITDPVIVKLTKENNEFYISFIDVGVGMSPDRIYNVYSQYFNSTKRNDNNQIGGFGIGGKTPLAYAESFFLITIHNGIKYTYSIRKDKTSPVMDLLNKAKTTERNGTTVKIPVKHNDVNVFEREIIRQLYYFENVIFEGFLNGIVKNDYRIIEGKNFFYRGREYNQYVHICLGRVAYPIDFNVLDDNNYGGEFHQSDWNVPVAIKMEIGEINVTASREAIDYTEETKKLIKKKLKAVKEELLAMLEKQHEKLDSLEEYYRLEGEPASLLIGKDERLDIRSMTTQRLAKYHRLADLSIPSQNEVIHMFYDVSMIGKKGRRENTWDKSVRNIATNNVYLLVDDEETPRKKNAYMKNTFKHFYTITRKDMSIGVVKTLIKKITPTNSTTETRTIFKQFRELQKEIYKLIEAKVKKYSSVTVPQGFVVAKKMYNPKFELPVTYNSRNGFVKERIMVQDLQKSKATIYYGDLDDHDQVATASHDYDLLFDPKIADKFRISNSDYHGHPVRFIMVSKSNLRYINELPNVKPIAEFNQILLRKRDAVIKSIEKTYFLERFEKQNDLFINEKLFNHIDKDYAKKLKELKALKGKYDAVKTYHVYVHETSMILQKLGIDLKTLTYTGHDLFAKVEKTTENNGMLAYVKVKREFNPDDKTDDYYNEKDKANILKLLKLAYVK